MGWSNHFHPRYLSKGNENISPHEDLYTNVCTNFIYKSPRLGTIQMPLNKWMNKHTLVYSYNGILLSSDKEQTVGICNSIDKAHNHHSERSLTLPPKKSTHCMISHSQNSRKCKPVYSEKKVTSEWLPRDERHGEIGWKDYKGKWGNFGGWVMVMSLLWVWWRFHRCIYVKSCICVP